ncbi:MAG: CBS domain-containing protein [Oscillospiraceae bacterium]|jgi:CBS domain-containing protein
MEISEIMTGQVVSICEDEPVIAAARLMKQYNFGAVPVRDERGKLKGIVTDRDIVLRCVAPGASPRDLRVSEIMSRNIETVSPHEDAAKAAERMAERQVRRLPVTDGGVLVGIVALGDMARCRSCDMEAGEALSGISENFRRK